ncbi:MAG: protein disulfide oxidoreductase [Gallionella sp.]|nr:protein disulfide oxidoreductase [Gallionella sp.]
MSANKTSRSRIWYRRAIQVVLLVVLVVVIRAWQQRDVVSGMAPPLHGTTLDGRTYSLPVKPGEPVLVHFWATWCPVCRAEQGSIESIARDFPNVITVAMQSGNPEDVARYMREQGISFPVINDASGSISNTWGVHAVPASFIVDTNGEIRFVEIGFATETGLRLRLWLAGR